MEVVPNSRLCANCGNHNPSQTTLGNIYIAVRKEISMVLVGGMKIVAYVDVTRSDRIALIELQTDVDARPARLPDSNICMGRHGIG